MKIPVRKRLALRPGASDFRCFSTFLYFLGVEWASVLSQVQLTVWKSHEGTVVLGGDPQVDSS